MFIVFIGSNLT